MRVSAQFLLTVAEEYLDLNNSVSTLDNSFPAICYLTLISYKTMLFGHAPHKINFRKVRG